ncbi:adenylate kinase [Roseomonas sp. CCTCC AB2023176]|uniref:adenylate kinase n=1 Tax=Roseomonas sp. CCTCC AB2023176 TaxID=3342640 RepID=UPI0035DDB698
MRVLVVGISGAGKSVLAERIAAAHGLPRIELDAYFWGPDWTPFGRDAMRASVGAAIAAPGWVADGYYVSQVGDLLWPRATHLVWLDYPRRIIMARVIRRSLLRAATRRPLWNGNRERWSALLTADHPIRYAWRNALPRRAAIEARLALPEHAHLVVHRLRHPWEAVALALTDAPG